MNWICGSDILAMAPQTDFSVSYFTKVRAGKSKAHLSGGVLQMAAVMGCGEK